MPIQIKRIYEDPSETDGYRILVDRLWPRGITKQMAQLDEWNKAIAPSTMLRKTFNHQPELFVIFRDAYKKELALQPTEIERILELSKSRMVTLLYGAKDPQCNQAVVLLELLQQT